MSRNRMLLRNKLAGALQVRNTSSSSTPALRNTSPANKHSHNQRDRARGVKCVVTVRLDGKTIDRLDALVPELGGWGKRRSRVIQLAIGEFLERHARKGGGK